MTTRRTCRRRASSSTRATSSHTASVASDRARLRAPALVIRAGDLAVRAGTDDRTQLGLHVALDDRLGRTASLLAPHERDLRPDLDLGIDHRQREEGAFVVAVAG